MSSSCSSRIPQVQEVPKDRRQGPAPEEEPLPFRVFHHAAVQHVMQHLRRRACIWVGEIGRVVVPSERKIIIHQGMKKKKKNALHERGSGMRIRALAHIIGREYEDLGFERPSVLCACLSQPNTTTIAGRSKRTENCTRLKVPPSVKARATAAQGPPNILLLECHS